MQVTSGKVESNGIELFYDARGPEQGEAIVFVMGLAAQMVFWPEPLLDDLAARGYRVIRFDNRDVGLSTRLRAPLRHSPMGLMGRYMTGLPIAAPYTLHDLVEDTCGLLDALGIQKAHLVGASMGGMISQLMAAHRPDRVASLTSIMSSPNSRLLPPPKPAALKTLVGPRVAINSADEYVTHGMRVWRVIGGTLQQGDDLLEGIFRQAFERGLYPRGVLQQFTGIMATGGFARDLRRVTAPTTVIHGSHDPLIRVAGGKATARAIRDARLAIIPGMGHDLPQAALAQIADLIHDNALRVEPQGAPVALA
ncbi:MAG: alpha/beta hydrolase [Alcanivoracaceae bacterium]|nr:alpha/beta hydrolase [Alcanivoracaceae bacterium]